MLTRTVYSQNQEDPEPVTVKAYPTGEEMWHQEATHNVNKSKETYEAIMNSHEGYLCRVETVFPFTFFPDIVYVDRDSVTIEYGMFFFSKKYHTFYLDQIHNVRLTKGVLFSSLFFEIDGYESDPPLVTYLWNNDAAKIKETVDGLLLTTKSQIDPHHLSDEELRNLMKKFTPNSIIQHARL